MTDPALPSPQTNPADRAKSRLERMFGRPVTVRPLDGKKPMMPGETPAKRPFFGLVRRMASVAMTLVVFSAIGNLAEYGPHALGNKGYTGWSETHYGQQLKGWQQTIADQPAAVQVAILDVDRYLAQDGDKVNLAALARNQMLDQLGYLSRGKTELITLRADLAEGQANQTAAAHCAMGALPSPHERLSSARPEDRHPILEHALHKTCGVVLFFNLSTGEDIARSQSFAHDPRYGTRYVLTPSSFQDFVIAHELGHTLDFNLGGLGGEHEQKRTLEDQRAFVAKTFETTDPAKAEAAAENLYQTMRGESFADGVGLIAHIQKHGSQSGLYQLMAAARTISSWHAHDLTHYTVPVLRAAYEQGVALEASGQLKSMTLTDIARVVQDHAMSAAPDRAEFKGLVAALDDFSTAAEQSGRVYIAYDSSPERAEAVTAAMLASNGAVSTNRYVRAFIEDYAASQKDLFIPQSQIPEAQRYYAQLRQLLDERGDNPMLRAAIIEAQDSELRRLESAARSIGYADRNAAIDPAILAARRAALNTLRANPNRALPRQQIEETPMPAPNGLKM